MQQFLQFPPEESWEAGNISKAQMILTPFVRPAIWYLGWSRKNGRKDENQNGPRPKGFASRKLSGFTDFRVLIGENGKTTFFLKHGGLGLRVWNPKYPKHLGKVLWIPKSPNHQAFRSAKKWRRRAEVSILSMYSCHDVPSLKPWMKALQFFGQRTGSHQASLLAALGHTTEAEHLGHHEGPRSRVKIPTTKIIAIFPARKGSHEKRWVHEEPKSHRVI